MNRSEFLKEIKCIVESEVGCITKSTPKKGEGFVPYNRFNIKWGQMDSDSSKNHIRLVFDLKRAFLSVEEFSERTGLSITPPRRIFTGYRFTEAKNKQGHDQLIIFLEDTYLAKKTDALNEIFLYTREFTLQSSFKTQSSR